MFRNVWLKTIWTKAYRFLFHWPLVIDITAQYLLEKIHRSNNIVWGEWISILSKTNIVIFGFWQRLNASLRLRSPRRWRRMRWGLRKLACRRPIHSCVSIRLTCWLRSVFFFFSSPSVLLIYTSFFPPSFSLFPFSLSPCPSSSPLFISMLLSLTSSIGRLLMSKMSRATLIPNQDSLFSWLAERNTKEEHETTARISLFSVVLAFSQFLALCYFWTLLSILYNLTLENELRERVAITNH